MTGETEKVEVPLELWGAVISNQLTALDDAFASASPDERLEGFVAVLGYVINHLKRFPGFNGGTALLDDLLLRLADVMAGTPSLRPAKRSGRAPQGWRDAIIQGRAAGVVDFLMSRGESEVDACKVVAVALNKGRVKGRRGGPISEATVRHWRSQAAPFGEKKDALAVREGLTVLDGLPAYCSKSETRRFVTIFLQGGAVMRQLYD